jgi:hypothetical protein
VAAEGVPAPAPRRVCGHVAVGHGHGEQEIVVDLEAELGGEGEEGEGSFRTVRSGSKVGVPHIGSVGLGTEV